MIPVAAILLNYSIAQRAVREEIINSNDKSLRQFAGISDTRMAKMSSTAFQALNNTKIRSLASTYALLGDNYGYRIYEAKNYLAGLPMEEYQDLFIYYKGNGLIVSATYASLPAGMYLDVYYNGGPQVEGVDPVEVLRSGDPNLPRITLINRDRANPKLAVLYARNANYILGKGNLVAGVVFHPEKLQAMLRSAVYRPEGVVGILDAQGRTLAASGPIDRQFDLSAIQQADRIFEDEASVIQVMPSEVVDCTYVTVTPVSIFWERLNTLRRFSVGCVLLCLVASAGVAVMLSSRNYSPITTLLNTIYRKTNRVLPATESNEMAFIQQVLSHSLDENVELASRVAIGHDALRDDFLLHALAGSWNREQGEDSFSDSNIHLLSDRFLVMLFRLEDGQAGAEAAALDPKRQIERHMVMTEGFGHFCAQRHQGFIVTIGPGLFAGLINYAPDIDRKGAEEVAAEVARQMAVYVRNRLGLACTVAFSPMRFGLRGIHAAYSEANEAMRYRYLMGRGAVIRHSETACRTFQYDHDMEARAAQLMLLHVQGDQEESAAAVAAQVVDAIGRSHAVSLDTVECFKYDLIGSLNRILHETGTIGLEREQHLIAGLVSADTLADFEARLAEMLDSMRQHHAGHRSRYTICDRAADYIQEHYGDADLNVSQLGDALGISPSYLSKLFKEQHGLGPLDYLCKIRIRTVKSLLRSTQDTVDEIAQRTGFLSSGTLIKTFKKIEGITPGAYRKLAAAAPIPDLPELPKAPDPLLGERGLA